MEFRYQIHMHDGMHWHSIDFGSVKHFAMLRCSCCQVTTCVARMRETILSLPALQPMPRTESIKCLLCGHTLYCNLGWLW